MTDGGPKRPDESQSDYMRRLAEHNAEREKQRKRELRGDPRAHSGSDEMSQILNDDALLDNLGRKGGKGLQDELSNLLGAFRDDIDSEPLADLTEHLTAQAAADLAAYRNTKSAGKKKRLAKKNKGAWKNAAEKNKKSKGCAVIAVALLGAGGGVLYGLFEAGHALVSALGH
jgi:hypothetical protein